jgi:Undecaprenyl-phosphate glucose phosphotransferase
MPYDDIPSRTEASSGAADRRGPLRPERLQAARLRWSGETLARLVQASDVALLAGVWVAGWAARGFHETDWLSGAASLIALASLMSFEAYRLGARERLHQHVYRVLGAVGGAALLLLAVATRLGVSNDAIAQVVNWCLTAALFVTGAHVGWFLYLRNLRKRGLLTPNLMIVGATPAAERLISAALTSRDANILGVFDDRGARAPRDIRGVPVLGKAADVKNHRLLPYVDRIVVAVPPGATARIAQLIADLAPVPNSVSLLVDDHLPGNGEADHERLLNMPLAQLAGARQGAWRAAVKRAVDVALSAGALVALSPALVAIAVAVRLDSPGPALFKQRRHGYLNEEVLVWKFRSMKTELTDHTASRQVTANDDRVTRVGGFLRRTSLDELPQLWNVLKGEMSLVGPRPHAIGMLAGGDEASKLVESYAHRHRMKPGLTGWAAVNGSRGPVDTPEAVRRRVWLDLEYVERQSLWLDLSIMLRTLPCVLGDSAVIR